MTIQDLSSCSSINTWKEHLENLTLWAGLSPIPSCFLGIPWGHLKMCLPFLLFSFFASVILFLYKHCKGYYYKNLNESLQTFYHDQGAKTFLRPIFNEFESIFMGSINLPQVKICVNIVNNIRFRTHVLRHYDNWCSKIFSEQRSLHCSKMKKNLGGH